MTSPRNICLQRGVSRRLGGFTLIEVMVSMVILAMLVVLFAQIFGSISTAWGRGQEKMDNFAKARALLNRLQVDLQNIVAREDLAAFPTSDGTNSDFSFYTLQRGFDGANTNSRSLSYIKYAPSTMDGSDGRLLRYDRAYSTNESPDFADAPTPTPSLTPVSAPTPQPVTGLPSENDAPVLCQGSLGFIYGFRHPDGKYYPTYLKKDANGLVESKAIAVTVGILVMDNRSSRLLDNRRLLKSLISDFYVQKVDAGGVENWSPKSIWEYRLGLLSTPPGSDAGSRVSLSRYGASNLDTIKAFERSYVLPATMR